MSGRERIMDTQQIKSFLTAAKCLNFTEAASQLFISQPTLSRQILNMEKELNMQLFIRRQKSVQLTPAGAFLYDKLSALYHEYTDIIHMAQIKAAGYSDIFRIGILDGHDVNALFPNLMKNCFDKYPNVQISLTRGSFHVLTDSLYNGSVDLIFTLLFDIDKKEQLSFLKVKSLLDVIVMPKAHPLASRDEISLADLADEQIFLISPEDSSEAASRYLSYCHSLGFFPKFRYAPNLETEMLWAEAGLGIALINDYNILAYHPGLKILPVREFQNNPDTDLVAAWHSGSQKPFLKNFLKELKEAIRS